MEAAKELAPNTEPLSWADICARYPDQYVCLVDIVHPPLRSPEILSARVVGHGATDDEAFEPICDLAAQFPRFAVRFTGVCTEPLIRPPVVVIDDEDYPIIRR